VERMRCVCLTVAFLGQADPQGKLLGIVAVAVLFTGQMPSCHTVNQVK